MADATNADVIQSINDQSKMIRDLSIGPPSVVGWFKTSSASSIPLFGVNGTRRMAIIVNTDANDLWIRYGAAASTASGGWTYKIPAGATWEMPQPAFTGAIYGIWTAAGAGVAEVTEF